MIACAMLMLAGCDYSANYTEADFKKQSLSCETATKLSSGEVYLEAWVDCMRQHGKIRSREERMAHFDEERSPWHRAWIQSQSYNIHRECVFSAAKQVPMPTTGDFKNHDENDIWLGNVHWNACMRSAGIFQ